MSQDSVQIFREALKTFDSPAVTQRWMITPHAELNGLSPAAVLCEEGGFAKVNALLAKIRAEYNYKNNN